MNAVKVTNGQYRPFQLILKVFYLLVDFHKILNLTEIVDLVKGFSYSYVMIKKRGVELIIFDLDGTLIDSRIDIANSVNYTLKQLGLNSLEEEIILGYVGDGVRSLIERALSPSNLNLFEKD